MSKMKRFLKYFVSEAGKINVGKNLFLVFKYLFLFVTLLTIAKSLIWIYIYITKSIYHDYVATFIWYPDPEFDGLQQGYTCWVNHNELKSK